MKLSLLICTVEERKEQFEALKAKLSKMIEGYGGIEIISDCSPRYDEPGGLTVGEKRQLLIDLADGKYICFVDDDDDVTDNFIKELHPLLSQDVDVINAKVCAYINGNKHIIDQSIYYENEQLHEGETKRYPSVMSVWSRALTKKVRFKPMNCGEDFDWTKQMNPQSEIKVYTTWQIYNYSDEHTIVSKSPKRCIVTFSNTERYNRLAERLKETAKPFGYDFIHFKTFDEINCREHSQHPYAFKPYAIHKCRDLGYNSILWIDSAIYLTQDPIKVFQYIERNGYMLFDNIGHNMGTYTNDDCLSHFNISRSDSFNIKMVMACSMGFNFHNKEATKVFEEWMGKAYSTAFQGAHEQIGWDGKTKGHRHDQSAISCIAHNKSLSLIHPSETFIVYNSWSQSEMPRAETVCMISAG